MNELYIKLDTIDKVKNFVTTVINYDCDIDITSEFGRYLIDGKSIMGIFSLDLSKRLKVIIHDERDDVLEKIHADLKPYLA